MTSTTKQFAWKDRDTAAHDLLQIVYHAPPFMSLRAARLLIAIRSPKALPELKAIFLDETRNNWVRIYTLRAFSALSGDFLVTELEPFARMAIIQREETIRKSRNPNPNRVYLELDLLNDILGLADKHPSNRAWLFKILEESHEPIVLRRLLSDSLIYSFSDEFRQLLINRLLKLLDELPVFLDLSMINLLTRNMKHSQIWLDNHFDEIVKICMNDYGDTAWRLIVRNWSRLADTLRQRMDNFDEMMIYSSERNPELRNSRSETPNFLESPAYKYLFEHYEKAADDDDQAIYQLYQIAQKWQGNIPVRAVATHFIGKLHNQFDTFLILSRLLRYGNDDWCDYSADSPVRYEAGEALLKQPSVDTWEVLVDSFFINPRDVLSDFQINWIAHMTDALSGENKDYKGGHYGEIERRGWFRALTKISEDEFQQIIK